MRAPSPMYGKCPSNQKWLKSPAAESFKTFLAIKNDGDELGPVADARRRVGNR